MIKEQKLLQKEIMFKNNSIMNCNKININTTNQSRPLSSISGYKNIGRLKRSQSAKNIQRPSTSKTFMIGNSYNLNKNNNYINTSMISFSMMNYRSSLMNNNYILDKNEANSLKGKLILTKYTNSEGIIDIGPLPYDSYFVEVQEGKQYRNIGFILKFNTIFFYYSFYIFCFFL